jgi:predicted secreted Zn-dependent protease
MRAIVVFLLILICSSARAEKLSSAYKVEYYEVSGSTVRQLEMSMNRNGPPVGNRRGWARTDLNYVAHWMNSYLSAGYTTTSVKVDAEIVVHLPKWKEYNEVGPCMQMKWDKLLESLLQHELKHIALAEGLDKEMERKISAVPLFSTVIALEKAAKLAQRKAMEQNAVKQRRFDRVTAHGSKDPTNPVRFGRC